MLWSDLSPHSKKGVIVLLVEQDTQRQDDKFLEDVVQESLVDAEQKIAKELEGLALEGAGIREATESVEKNKEEEEGTKNKA
ncbi:hypothetical protein C0993_007603 [Termitomyces sp. T159_Od127]|nr:hypothetical protein C0993_007603 [Termitomyces sp. T159_Od127]